jgi:hypothetical protein
MVTINPILEKDICVICLLDEEESSKLTNNDKCPCRYSYHKECMINIITCPYCKIPFSTISLPTGQIQQVYQPDANNSDSFCFKFIFVIIVVAILSVIGYFSAVLS